MASVNKWLLVVILNMVTITNLGVVFAIGSLFLEMMDTFQTSRAATATVQSLLIGVTFGFGVVSGILVSKFSFPKVMFISGVMVSSGLCVSFFATNIYFLYVSIGVVSATGISMALITSLTLAGQMFTGTPRLVCISVLNTGMAIGAIIYPYFLDWINGMYGLFGTFLILGGITCNTFVLFVMCFVNPAIKIAITSSNNSVTAIAQNDARAISENQMKCEYIKELFTLPFVFLLFATGIAVSATNGFNGLMLDITVSKGFSDSQGLNAIIVFNIFSLISRLLPVILKYKTGISIFVCSISAAISGGIGQVLLYISSDYLPYMVGISLCGLCLGGILSSMLIIVVKIVRQDQNPVAYGLLYSVIGLLTTFSGALLGRVRDIYGSYAPVILILGGVKFTAAFFYSIVYIYQKCTKSSKEAFVSIEISVVSEHKF